jgi:hypothetical protein
MSETLIGVIIGALAAIVGSVIGALITYYLDFRRSRRIEKKEVYELVETSVFYTNPNMVKYLETPKLLDLIEKTQVKLSLYSNNVQLKTLYSQIGAYLLEENTNSTDKEFRLLCDTITELMRKDLNL